VDIGIIGAGVNGLCCAWDLAQRGHTVTLYERDRLMSATGRASSKLLHGGLRYLENFEIRLVREALPERDEWIKRTPELAKPLRLVIPVYKRARRHRWLIKAGLFLYYQFRGKLELPKTQWLRADEIKEKDPRLNPDDLLGGFEFSDGQMDDYALGLWVADQAKAVGINIMEETEVQRISNQGELTFGGRCIHHDKLINVTGPWVVDLLERSDLRCPYKLDLARGSHLIINHPVPKAYLLEVPNDRRIFFVLPWQGKMLVGTTEVRQSLNDPVLCSPDEEAYPIRAFEHYFPGRQPAIDTTFAGVRPLLHSANDPSNAIPEYAIHHDGRLTTILGGKWTTALALARKITQTIRATH
jgi:glycerol-3-phosphate dehydrogenase